MLCLPPDVVVRSQCTCRNLYKVHKYKFTDQGSSHITAQNVGWGLVRIVMFLKVSHALQGCIYVKIFLVKLAAFM